MKNRQLHKITAHYSLYTEVKVVFGLLLTSMTNPNF